MQNSRSFISSLAQEFADDSSPQGYPTAGKNFASDADNHLSYLKILDRNNSTDRSQIHSLVPLRKTPVVRIAHNKIK